MAETAERESPVVDWSEIDKVCAERAWLVAEAEHHRVNFDAVGEHRDNCNVNPAYHKGVETVWKRGCDCGALKAAQEKLARD